MAIGIDSMLYRWSDDAHVISYANGILEISSSGNAVRIKGDLADIECLFQRTAKERGVLSSSGLSDHQNNLLHRLLDAGILYPTREGYNCDIGFSINKVTEHIYEQTVIDRVSDLISCSSICIVGVGTLSSWLIPHLLIFSDIKLTLVDYDTVQRENICRSPVFDLSALGQRKTEVFSDYVRARQGGIKVSCINEKVESTQQFHGLTKDCDFDLIVLTADEPSDLLAEIFSEIAEKRGTPVIRASRLGVGPICIPRNSNNCLACEFTQEITIDNESVNTGRTRKINSQIRKSILTSDPAKVAADLFNFMLLVLMHSFLPQDKKEVLNLCSYGTRDELKNIHSQRCVMCGDRDGTHY